METTQDMSNSGWRRFEEAFGRHDTAEVDRWIGSRVSFTAEPYVSEDESLVRARRVDGDDRGGAALYDKLFAAIGSGDLARIHAASDALTVHEGRIPRILCHLHPDSAKAIFRARKQPLFSTFDVDGILRKVDFESKCMWVEPVSYRWSQISL